jgi:hypothetical protein
MTVPPVQNDAIAESLRLIDAIERRQADLPFAAAVLNLHREAHRELEQRHDASEAAVGAWRAALARRWDSEVAGRRLYKQVLRQLTDHLGDDAPLVQMISRGGAEANSTPNELLEDLRRVQAALTLEVGALNFAAERLAQLEQACVALEQAIETARATEHERRNAVLDNRMAREAFRRVCEETFGKLSAFYGERFNEEFQAFFDAAAA